MKTVVQSDFDGTITEEDVSFLLLDRFADSDWRQLWNRYMEGKISVGFFNTRAFAMVKADKQTLLDYIFKSVDVKIRPGFQELLDYCSRQDFKFVIVSNGLDFYIEAILQNRGIKNIEVFAAQSRFSPAGLDVKYIGPEGIEMADGFKEAYALLSKANGCNVVYLGNGASDIYPARRADHVFAIDELLKRCREAEIKCQPFHDLHDVVRGLKTLPPG